MALAALGPAGDAGAVAQAPRVGKPRPAPPTERPHHCSDAETPALAVLVDTFEQPVQRPKDRAEADTYYSGKKKRHTLKSQVARFPACMDLYTVNEAFERVCVINLDRRPDRWRSMLRGEELVKPLLERLLKATG